MGCSGLRDIKSCFFSKYSAYDLYAWETNLLRKNTRFDTSQTMYACNEYAHENYVSVILRSERKMKTSAYGVRIVPRRHHFPDIIFERVFLRIDIRVRRSLNNFWKFFMLPYIFPGYFDFLRFFIWMYKTWKQGIYWFHSTFGIFGAYKNVTRNL